jgi:nitroimidazol reductase NimA-like FMN-containing flavoprotein (pyridoxamine 5'-phosphate oxidase superfamily)
MIRPDRRMSEADAVQILKEGKYGVLSTATLEGIPYGVPLNYFYVEEDNALYFHCFIRGRKLDYIKENSRVSFVVIGKENLVAERFVTHYESVIVTGRAILITEEEEKIKKLIQLCEILAPSVLERRDEVIKKQLSAVTIVKIEVDEISGKRNQDY